MIRVLVRGISEPIDVRRGETVETSDAHLGIESASGRSEEESLLVKDASGVTLAAFERSSVKGWHRMKDPLTADDLNAMMRK